MRMQSVPQIEVVLIDSGESPTGVGEVSVPAAAPALTNAIFALTGTGSAGSPSPRPSESSEKGHPMPDVTITPTEDGLCQVSGPFRLTDVNGREIPHPDPVNLCGCGQSANAGTIVVRQPRGSRCSCCQSPTGG
jgi:hypothetical protein